MKANTKKSLIIISLFTVHMAAGAYYMVRLGKGSGTAKTTEAVAKKPRETTAQKRRAVLHEALLAKNEQIEDCYEGYLRTEPSRPEGAIHVQWSIGETGEVVQPEVIKAEINDPTLIGCVLDQVRSLEFSALKKDGPTLLAHKFNFRRRSPASVSFQ